MRVLALDQCAYSDNYLIDVTREWKLERNWLSMRPRSMSIHSGQKRKCRRFHATSAMPRSTDIARRGDRHQRGPMPSGSPGRLLDDQSGRARRLARLTSLRRKTIKLGRVLHQNGGPRRRILRPFG